jgi:hypothetical protein
MGMQTFLGPILTGTQKNTNPAAVTSATPSVNFLTGNGGGYRNTGAGDNFQFISIPATTLTGIAAASYPYTFIPTYTVSGVAYPLAFPAGSYIDNIDLIVNTAITFSGSPTSLAIEVQLVGAPGTTYATAQTIATATLTAASLPTIGVYATGNTGTSASATNPIVYTGTATPLAMLQNSGASDCLLQLKMTFTGGTTPAISAGAIGFAVNYVMRNPDGTWYPQTPPSTFPSIPPVVY